ncbi:U3 small nucleolar RNA-associated protein 11 [Xylariaceae sp. FL0662B]|nr:U3 small nucleolar RNA-associated protein 11 [Xylariaceae sp. FL0662B]
MSSIRNAVQRRVHRERAQPIERQRLGLLEKHKDYSLRAKDFNKKKTQLRSLRQKAADRNEDEFYFGMLSRTGPGNALSKGKRWKGTAEGDRGNRALDVDTVRLLKTQDMGYIRTVRNVSAKEVKALEERVLGLGGSIDAVADVVDEDDDDGFEDEPMPARLKPRKTVFTEAVAERDERIRREAEKEEADEGDADDIDMENARNPEALRAEQRQRLLEKMQRRLQNARKKLKALARAENELELQRARMAKTATVGGVTKSGKKIKVRERKR